MLITFVVALKVGVTGFCMGGALAFASAATHGDGTISAAAAFYGIPDQKMFQLEKISIPVQGHFAKLDNIAGFSDPEVKP